MNIKNLKTAVKIHGTLNNSKDIDKFWTVEMAIPLKEITELNNQNLNLQKTRVNGASTFLESIGNTILLRIDTKERKKMANTFQNTTGCGVHKKSSTCTNLKNGALFNSQRKKI